ncbi:hypothetical protein MXG66_004879 [Salmonella enterica]|nr:hypothetical protein [Salmonella enterica]EDR4378249.1 hypothetical protein [Salmonella enterica]EEG5735333.1 hypothetical protein [Salmonella enterica]EEG6159398.1 hypothetical protein [Salmonella enterica]EEH7435718.1 hypothetical protein [Salmonella enterica]
MKTKKIQLTPNWIRVCDGTKSVFMERFSGSVGFCVSRTKPVTDADCHILIQPVTITPPTIVWVKSTRAYKQDTVITVSEMD